MRLIRYKTTGGRRRRYPGATDEIEILFKFVKNNHHSFSSRRSSSLFYFRSEIRSHAHLKTKSWTRFSGSCTTHRRVSKKKKGREDRWREDTSSVVTSSTTSTPRSRVPSSVITRVSKCFEKIQDEKFSFSWRLRKHSQWHETFRSAEILLLTSSTVMNLGATVPFPSDCERGDGGVT